MVQLLTHRQLLVTTYWLNDASYTNTGSGVIQTVKNPSADTGQICKEYTKSSDAKASMCHWKFCSRMTIFIKLVYLSSVISLKWQLIGNLHCHLS